MEKEDPFEVIYLFQTKEISCYGCGKKYVRDREQNNLIVSKFCEREYTIGGAKKSKNQYAYMHLKTSCILGKFPKFKKDMLSISKESTEVVPKEVKDKLSVMGVQI